MYRIVAVDDEPTGLNHICMILEKKCPQYEIVGTAENGKEALEIIRKEKPDVLIADVRMPVLDGISLVEQVKNEFPEILSVIVSGYSEFEYAKQALKHGVSDYLLKPLLPADMKESMDKLEIQLNSLYYEKRNLILSTLCNGREINEEEQISRYFYPGRYYSALFRRNGLPRRFSRNNSPEIFSMEEEKIYLYGRDEMEALYLVPVEWMPQQSFEAITQGIFNKERKKGDYVTGIIYKETFALEELKKVAKILYRKLDEAIVIGESRMVSSEQPAPGNADNTIEKEKSEYIEYLIRHKECGSLPSELKQLFSIWSMKKYNQFYVEAGVRYLFRQLQNIYPPENGLAEQEYMIDEAFYYASDMRELEENIIELVKQSIPDFHDANADDKDRLFQAILFYLTEHIIENITMGEICREFGVSQTSLSRLFRRNVQMSFGNYLTKIRIEHAKKLMRQNPNAYVREIAERCGYSDQFYFSRIFRSVTGLCPSEYLDQTEGKSEGNETL